MATRFLSAATSSTLLFIAVQILLYHSADAGNLLKSGETLLPGKRLSIGDYYLAMQNNCNLELFHCKNLTWESHTTGMGTKCFLYMQTNGELAIFSEGTSRFVWMTGTGGSGSSYVLVLQPDGNAVVYSSTAWSTAAVRANTTKSIP